MGGAQAPPGSASTATPLPVPPSGPATLEAPRSFQFVVSPDGKPKAAIGLESDDDRAVRKCLAPGAKVAAVSPEEASPTGAGLNAFAFAVIDEACLPASLRLRGVMIDIYADDVRICGGELGAARVGAQNDARTGRTEVGSDFLNLLQESYGSGMFYDIDLPSDCAEQLQSSEVRVAWARDASLPKPVIVAKAQRAMSPGAQEDVRQALQLIRATRPFLQSQRSLDFGRAEFRGLPSLPLEQQDEGWDWAAHWTRFSWKGVERGYFALNNDCPPPGGVRVGFDFRVNAQGALEILPGVDRHTPEAYPHIPNPAVLADVDADGSLEAIEARTYYYRLASFDLPDPYVGIQKHLYFASCE